jgi:hypothetical protein
MGLHNFGKAFMKQGMKHILGNGRKIRLWHEVWLGDCPLRIKYGRIYNICFQQDWEGKSPGS